MPRDQSPDVARAGGHGLKLAVLTLLGLQAGALGLKAWDDHRTSDAAELDQLSREAAALAARIDARIDSALTALSLAQRQGFAIDRVVETVEGLDTVSTLKDAARAPAGSRLKAAAGLSGQDGRAYLTDTGHIAISYEAAGSPQLVALAPAEAWLPAPPAGTRHTLSQPGEGEDQSVSGLGDPDLAGLTATGYTALGGLERAATACAPLAASAVSACVSTRTDLLAPFGPVRLAGYGLLLVLPALALVGLWGVAAPRRPRPPVAASAPDDGQVSLILEAANAAYWSCDPAMMTFTLSDPAARLFGLGSATTLDRARLLDLAHPQARERLEAALDTAAGTRHLHTTVIVKTTEGERALELRAGQAGGRDDLAGFLIDVTEQKRTDARLRAAERRLRSALEGFSGPLALWDHRKRLLYWNKAFAIWFGLEDTLRAGMSHDTVALARAGALRNEKTSTDDAQTTLFQLHSGNWIKLVERTTPEGGLITLGLDVTDHVRTEEQLEKQKTKLKRIVLELERSEGRADVLARRFQEEKARAEHASNTKGAFLANMSHELRTPLNAINGFSEILVNELYGPLGDTRYKEYAADILASGQHLLDMINDILDMAKIEAGKMTVKLVPIDPVDPVDAAIRMIRRKAEDKQIDLTLDVADGLPDIVADHRAIRQMVLNLLTNAIKFTDAGGRIIVAIRRTGPNVVIAVTDTGIGIPKDEIPRLGRPFEQVSDTTDRNSEGTGLGLALTRSFAEMHGGSVRIESELGVGTSIAIILPIDAAGAQTERTVEPANDVAPPPASADAGGGLR